jgi:RNAse (barnase) inhibitor barstar
MKRLSSMLTDTKASGVYLTATTFSAEDLQKSCTKHSLMLFHFKKKAIRTKAQFLDYCAKILDFPYYFGRNWDALEDCLKDMEWIKAKGFVILYEQFGEFAENSPDEFDQALDIFKEVSEYWRENEKMFIVLLHGRIPTTVDFTTVEN